MSEDITALLALLEYLNQKEVGTHKLTIITKNNSLGIEAHISIRSDQITVTRTYKSPGIKHVSYNNFSIADPDSFDKIVRFLRSF